MVKIIKNGRVIDPESRFDGRADLWIENGKIQKIVKKDTKAESDGASDAPSIPADAEVLDAEGLIVAPGLVDVHVHFRDPGLTYKEDIETGAAAAKAGGFTTVVCMANTKPVADTPEIVRYILEKGAKTGIHVETCAAVSKGFQGKELTDMDALKEAGAIGFTDDGIPLMSEKLVKEAMETAKRLNVPLSFHEEDPAFIFNNGINRGPVSEQLGIGGSPALAEDSMVARDCMIALHTGADVDIPAHQFPQCGADGRPGEKAGRACLGGGDTASFYTGRDGGSGVRNTGENESAAAECRGSRGVD